MISRLGLQTEAISPQEVENCTSEQSHSAEEQVLEMQSICAKADSHVHISRKLHIQGSAGPPAGAASGAGAGAGPGARKLAIFLNIFNIPSWPTPVRVEAPETTNKAATTKRGLIIVLELPESELN